MRYLNWDVLLFPSDSRTPIQEFETKYHLLPDTGHTLKCDRDWIAEQHFNYAEPVGQIPTLTSFIPSLDRGTSFRISLHSWDTPKPSPMLTTLKTHDEVDAFEARVYIDGEISSRKVFDESTTWPEVIGFTGNDGDITNLLRFPSFHSEILNQAHWEPGDEHGRIRVVLAEGTLRRGLENKMQATFDRLRDMIVFSFQHAPTHVLEYSGIAWPNTRISRKILRSPSRNTANYVIPAPDFEAHAHSPQRKKTVHTQTKLHDDEADPLLTTCQRRPRMLECDDPFTDSSQLRLRDRLMRRIQLDQGVSLDECAIFETSHSNTGTDMSGISYQKPDFERSVNEAAIIEIVQALTPQRREELLMALTPKRVTSTYPVTSRVQGNIRASSSDNNNTTSTRTQKETSRINGVNDELFYRMNHYKGNLLASRYADLPFSKSSSMTSPSRPLPTAFAASVDPFLPNSWLAQRSLADDTVAGTSGPLFELESRSSSISSKRKRLESPNFHTPNETNNKPQMSTSPCKKSVTRLPTSAVKEDKHDSNTITYSN